MLDLVIRGGQVVSPHGVGSWDVAIHGERIVALAEPGTLTDDVARVVDARGKLVVPGGIDPHIHCGSLVPTPGPDGQPEVSAPPPDVSRAAIHGGTTTLIDFALWSPGETIQQAVERRDAEWRGQCYTDYAFHVILHGDIPPDVLDQIPETVQAGHPSIKIFTTNVRPVTGPSRRKVGFGHLWEVLQRVARAGGITAVHAEDDDIVMYMYEKLIREGRVHFSYLPDVHNTISEDLAFRRVIRLAELVDGAALYMVHTSAVSGVRAIEESRARGFPIYGETLHHYVTFTREDYKRPNGQIYHTYPSLKGEEDTRALWNGLATGSMSTVATDGICTPLAVKTRGERIDDTTGGNSGVAPRLAVTYTEAVVKRGLSLERFVDLTSANAARILGLYPRKGAIAVGSDADVAILDTSRPRAIRVEDLHESDYSPWAGWEVHAWPVMTILRGKIVVEEGQRHGALTDGRHLPRRVADAILAGPAC